MKRVLVTGGSGFVGNSLARRLLADGHEVHLLLRPGYSAWRLEDLRTEIQTHTADLRNEEALVRAVRDIRPEWVFHLAAYGAYSSQTDIRRILRTNVIGTANLIRACLETGFEAFVNTGSSSEYGFKDHSPAETESLEPNSYYAVTKASATLFCRYTSQRERMPITTLRLYSVYGPYEEPTRLMPTLILRGLEGDLPALVDPEVARDYVYVDDVNEAYLLAATSKGQELGAVYNVGTGVQTTLRQVVDVAQRALPITANPRWGTMGNRIWDTDTWVCDNRHIRAALGWQPRCDFETGFRAMVNWFRANPAWREAYASRWQRTQERGDR